MAEKEKGAMANVDQAADVTVSMEELKKELQAARDEAEAAKIDKELAQKELEAMKQRQAENQKGHTEKELTPGQKRVAMERRIQKAMEEAKKDTVNIRLPLLPGSEEDEVFVGVNGYRYQIKRGMDVEVPVFVAEALKNSENQKLYAHNTMRALQAKAEEGEKKQML